MRPKSNVGAAPWKPYGLDNLFDGILSRPHTFALVSDPVEIVQKNLLVSWRFTTLQFVNWRSQLEIVVNRTAVCRTRHGVLLSGLDGKRSECCEKTEPPCEGRVMRKTEDVMTKMKTETKEQVSYFPPVSPPVTLCYAIKCQSTQCKRNVLLKMFYWMKMNNYIINASLSDAK